ncbi:hypothetical protein AOLI_G00141440 [Acnodon oligacanthus]
MWRKEKRAGCDLFQPAGGKQGLRAPRCPAAPPRRHNHHILFTQPERLRGFRPEPFIPPAEPAEPRRCSAPRIALLVHLIHPDGPGSPGRRSSYLSASVLYRPECRVSVRRMGSISPPSRPDPDTQHGRQTASQTRDAGNIEVTWVSLK